MNPLPWATTLIVLITLIINTVFMPFTAWHLQNYYFNPIEPFNNFGLTLVSSLFLHQSYLHLMTNLCGLILFQQFIKKAVSQKQILILIFGGHLLTLLGLSLTFLVLKPEGHHLYVGLSAAVYTLISFALFTEQRKIFLFIFLGWVFFDVGPLFTDPHFLFWSKLPHFYAAAIGISFGWLRHKKLIRVNF